MNKEQLTSKDQNRIWSKLIYVLIAVIFVAPFFRGLFFEKEFYPVSAAIGILAVLIIGSNESKGFKVKSYIEYFAIGFGAIYLINFPFSYNKELASFELVKNITYVIVFVVMAKAIKQKTTINVLVNALIGSATLISLLGIGAGMGIINYNGAFLDGMINSTFQYHNTFGAYMLAILFLAMGKIAQAGKKSAYYYTICANLLFLGFVFSYSRGAWILLPPIGLVAMLLMDQKSFSKVISVLTGILISSIPFISKIQTAMNTTDKNGVKFVLISSFVMAVITFIIWKFEDKININKKIAIGSLLILAIGFAGIVGSGKATTILPASISERIAGISLKTFTVIERNMFYKDAMKIVKENMIIGSGGGGWTSLYSKYKTYDYYTTQTHNYLLQVLIETGIPGLVAILGLFVSIIYQAYKFIKSKEQKERMLFIGSFCAFGVLAIHSIIDFDMALGGYALTFWILAGVISNEDIFITQNEENKGFFKKERKTLNLKYIALISSICIFISSASFGYAGILTSKNAELNEKKRFLEVLKNLEIAGKLNPYRVDIKIDIANTKLFLIQFENNNDKKKEMYEDSIKSMQLLEKIDGNKFENIVNQVKFYLKIGKIEDAQKMLSKLESNHPLNDNTYRIIVDAYMSIASYYVDEKNIDEAELYMTKIKDLYENMKNINQVMEVTRNEILKDVKALEIYEEAYVDEAFEIKLNAETLEKVKYAYQVLDIEFK